MSREVQTYLGYNSVVYADKRRVDLLDKKIKALEVELARLRRRRRRLNP